ncbi:MAG: carboxypeptidase-like regulatory domain-containing protein, partial [Pedobacter sp.]|nr:carboxypeptidase-like regulatory domain-containing protein [Pedobacter sp.]
MKPLILLFLLMLTVSMLKAQHTGVYRGQVLDSATHQPVGYVTIILAQISKPEQKKLTKGDGSFLFENLSSGNYQLTLVALGYRPLRTGFHFSAELPNVVPITFLISNKGYTLNEVTIKSAIPLVRQEPDKMIYDIQSDPDSKTDNMLQMMQKVPFLTLDGEDRLLLKGSTDFKVLIDGRSTGMMARNANDALRMLRASTIKQVEVITVSSAKYDSEGAAGIINIITRKNLAGLMSYNLLHANTRIGRGFESSVTAKKDRLGLYVWSGYWNHDLNANRINNLRSNFGPASLSVRQEGWNKSDGFDFPVIAELSYEIDSLNLLNASISTTKDVVHNSGEQLFTAIDQASATQYRFNLDNINTTSVNSYDIGLNYQLGFRNKKNTLLTLAYKFSRSANEFKDESAYLGLSNYPDQQLLQENKYGTDEHTIQLDFSGSISKVKFETGAKLIMRDYFSTDNYNMSGAPVGLINDELTYQQHILGLYHS